MIPVAFEYARPASLDEAFTLLREREDAKVLAGGHSLIPMMKLRLAEFPMLVDLQGVPDMRGITHQNGRFRIGAMTLHAALVESEELRRGAPALWDAARALGDPQVRNRGTIGGSCAHGDPSADYPSVMMALGATFTLARSGGSREVHADTFFTGMFETGLEPGELLTAISFADAPNSAYAKFRHPASRYALVGVAANLTLKAGTIEAARVAITGVGDSAYRASGLESALRGVRATDTGAVAAACAGVATGVDARSDAQASGGYRIAMADIYAARAIAAASLAR